MRIEFVDPAYVIRGIIGAVGLVIFTVLVLIIRRRGNMGLLEILKDPEELMAKSFAIVWGLILLMFILLCVLNNL